MSEPGTHPRIEAVREGDLTSGSEAPGVVVYPRGPGIDAIGEYSSRLVAALGARGTRARYMPSRFAAIPSDVDPAWILLQYNPFRYGRAGFAPRLLAEVRILRTRLRAPLAIMVHEAWIDRTDPRSTVIGTWQRVQLRALLRLADAVLTSTEALATELGGGAVHVPVATNITPTDTSPQAAREQLGLDGRLIVTLFGRSNPSRALDHAEAAVRKLSSTRPPGALTILHLGAGVPPLRVPAGVEVRAPGQLTEEELSLHLWASDLVLLPLADGVSTRRSTLMAALAHARPVLGLVGHNTDTVLRRAEDAIVLTPVGDLTRYAHAAVQLAGDPARLRDLGEAGAELYRERFDWPVLAGKVAGVLAGLRQPRSRSREIMFVGHNIGGSGGMEHATEQLIRRLLDAGHPVTVVARNCRIEPRHGLRFKRIRTPSAPFTLAYPTFFAVASWVAARRGKALLHTTGAVIGNRSDLSTVHYCHHAPGARAVGSRASQPGVLHEFNQRLGRIFSRSGEWWCYRPSRTALLCAVSSGVAKELESAFPNMRGAIRSIPNGVDSDRFAPSAAGVMLRDGLGIAHDARIALFVGGDWGRKGLAYAVEALEGAADWHLVVAGAGDPEPLRWWARRAGTEPRLHFLGPVSEMPTLYAAAEAFVLPTAYETFSLVTYEAAAAGVPLLVTPVNGVNELLIDGYNGWFIERDAGDIADRLNQLAANPELADSMAVRARNAVRGFSWDAMANAYLSIYAELSEDGSGLRAP